MKHTVFLVAGRTAAGKSTLTKEVAKNMNLKILKSYTDRPMRNGETLEDADHIFISKEQADYILANEKIIAYTDSVGDGYRRFATLNQLMESDIYIIDPVGIKDLKSCSLPELKDINLVEIYIRTPYFLIKEQAQKRGDDLTYFYKRYQQESHQFDEYEKEKSFHYHLLNDGTLGTSINNLIRIMRKELKYDSRTY